MIIKENMWAMFGFGIAAVLIMQLIVYLIGVFILRYTYNESIPKMNDNWTRLEIREAIFLALFLWMVGLYINPMMRGMNAADGTNSTHSFSGTRWA
jgi:hypothetical protein